MRDEGLGLGMRNVSRVGGARPNGLPAAILDRVDLQVCPAYRAPLYATVFRPAFASVKANGVGAILVIAPSGRRQASPLRHEG